MHYFIRSFKWIILFFVNLWMMDRATGQDFYKKDAIQEIKIYFSYSDWDYRLDTAKAGKENYILAEYCIINGQRFDSIGVKYKGNSSYRSNQVKNPLHLKLDWINESQDYKSYTSIKLGNNFSDPSAVREALSYEILSNYMDCSKANFARVYINDKYLGLYTNVEAVNKKFCSDHFGTSDHVFVKGNPDRPGNNSTSNLVYINKDSSSYYSYYGMENGFGWYKLIALIDTLKNNASALDKIMDIDRAIWMHAFNSVFSNYDSYTGSFSQNYYLYEDDFGRFLPVVWDLNMSIGGFPGSIGGGGGTTVDKIAFFNGETNAARPLIQKVLQNVRHKKMYTAHVRTFCKEFIANKEYQTIAKRLQAVVDTLVKNDPNSLTTYAAFQSSLTAAINSGGAPGGSVPGIYTLMDARLTYFNTISEFKAIPPSIDNIQIKSIDPHIGDTVWLSAKISNGNFAFLAFRKNKFSLFTKVEMKDDGLHYDGAPGDGVYGAYVIADTRKTQYYIYSENNVAGIFSPERAEYVYHTLEVNYNFPEIQKGELVINEFMSSNKSSVLDSTDTKYEDWIEIYNNTNEDVDLSGFFLSDDYTNPSKYEFPDYTSIKSKDRLVIWLDEDGEATGLHANFKLSLGGEELILSRPDGFVLDSLTFGVIPSDQSFERCPDGTGVFKIVTSSTYNKTNCATTSIVNSSHDNTRVYPNPAFGYIVIENNDEALNKVRLIDLKGSLVLSISSILDQNTYVDLQAINDGIFILELEYRDGTVLRQKLLVH